MLKLKDECITLAKTAKQPRGKVLETNNVINESQCNVENKFAIADETVTQEESDGEDITNSQNETNNITIEQIAEKQEKNQKIEKLLKLDENLENNESEDQEADDYISKLEQN